MEDDLKIIKVEYLSNQFLFHTHNFNSSLDDQTIFYKSFSGRRPPMADNLKILNEDYLANHLLDYTQICRLGPTSI